MSDRRAAEDAAVTWRRLTPTLCVGVGPEGVVGCIEIGRRCVVTNGEGRVFGRFRRLTDAQAVLALLAEDGVIGSHASSPAGRFAVAGARAA